MFSPQDVHFGPMVYSTGGVLKKKRGKSVVSLHGVCTHCANSRPSQIAGSATGFTRSIPEIYGFSVNWCFNHLK